MKPITLTVAGLHSFREKQTIDFGSLCEGGVFGIFGPTGSGKSSILDAMTLALYGKVERASNNTLGILNHAEEQLHVSFIFELENANGAKRYMIERSFKRADELRVKSAVSRLIEIGDESVVLADKIGEVNLSIQELLGLTIDDFTRAVVLPQGKFAEFLSLKGVDRRQMLQRLFNLEQYGDKLNKRLKSKLTKAKNELGEVIAEQTGLGDASSEAIKIAEQELKEVEILLDKRQTELTKVETDYERSKNIWEWQQQKVAITTRLEEVNQNKPSIHVLEEKVKQAEESDRVKPYLEEYEAARNSVETWTATYKTLHDQLLVKKVENNKSSQSYQQARAEKTEKLPGLVTRKQQLLDAKNVQEKITVLKRESEALMQKSDGLQAQKLEKHRLVEGMSLFITEELEKQKKRKEWISSKTISVNERVEQRKAYNQKQTIVHNRENLQELLSDVENKKNQASETEKQLYFKNEELLQGKKRLEALFVKTATTYDAVCNNERQSEVLIAKLEEMLSEKNQELEAIRRNNLAIQLAGQLKAGEACPVCGSTEHPNPVMVHDDHGKQLETEIKKLSEEITSVRGLSQEYTTLKLKLEQISQGIVQEYPGELNVTANEKGEQLINQLDPFSQIKALDVEQKSLQQDLIQLQETGRKAIQGIRAVVQQITQLKSTNEMNRSAYQEIMERVKKLEETIEAQMTEWNQTFTSVVFEAVETRLEEISKNDKLVQELSQEVEKCATILEQKENERNHYLSECNEIDRNMVECTSILRGKEDLLKELNDQLAKEIGNNDIDQLLKETEHMLHYLEETESKAYETWQLIQKECNKLENEAHAASQSLNEGKLRLEKATTKWNEVLSQTSFSQIEEVKAAHLSKEVQNSYKNQIETFWDTFKQLEAELLKINNLLQDSVLSLEKWEEIQQMREEMRAMLNEAVEAKGAALKALQVLRDKHERFNELEERRLELDELVELYNKLQSVFKGNSFVEYIAEEQLVQVSLEATERLGILTRQRYAIEVDSQGGFIMRDDANGGVRRPVTTLSGGETFLTSLALALSLSAQIQLRGEYPLQFFFLDEGFGTLDSDLLDTVVSALEKLHSEQLAVGVISHVQELRARLPKRLIVEPAEHSGRGTVVRLETL
ncbi:SbcC/MukB-like Walker B domain-containing protein [Fredinandcohnia sp. 179-A 10B2 NHS]|uniref:SbcC/MukB-like Walker B domain-containing protein n=1 Tax=Fredinandcohnia sp. 179-A 10B2 NHS TaxID=3235176 RepID=UPI0039A2D36C